MSIKPNFSPLLMQQMLQMDRSEAQFAINQVRKYKTPEEAKKFFNEIPQNIKKLESKRNTYTGNLIALSDIDNKIKILSNMILLLNEEKNQA